MSIKEMDNPCLKDKPRATWGARQNEGIFYDQEVFISAGILLFIILNHKGGRKDMTMEVG